jgi:hypothetical protein
MFDVRAIWQSTQGLPDAARGKAFEVLLNRRMGSTDLETLTGLIDRFSDPKVIKERLELASEFDKERMKEAGKYKMLFSIPETISQAFGNQAAMNVLGARSITDAYNATLQAYPRPAFASYQFQPRSYLS